MAYTSEELVDQVYLHLSGGQPTEDMDVQRIDIKKAMPSILAAVALIDSRRARNEARADKTSQLGVDPAWLITEFFEIQFDTIRDQRYFKFEKKVTLLDNVYGIANVGAERGDCVFSPSPHRFATAGVDHEFRSAGLVIWYYEKIYNEERVYIKYLPPVVEEVWVSYMPSFDDLDDKDIVPIPAGLELQVLQEAINFFAAEADRPADALNNHNDDRNGRNR